MSFANTAPGMVLMISVAGLIFSAATFRKVQFFRFKNQAGVTVLDLARSGKHAAELDAFIDALVKQIEVARSI